MNKCNDPLGILSFTPAPPGFHAQHSTRRRVFVYKCLNRIAPPIFDVGTHWHVDRALDCCAKLHAKYYSFHAGFLCDLKISELGRQIKKRKLYNREKSIELFLERILSISKKAEDRGIKIMIENNVLSANNKKVKGKFSWKPKYDIKDIIRSIVNKN